MRTGEAIGKLAREKGISLRQLSIKAGISYNTLYAAVNRKSVKIDKDTVRKIAVALDSSIAEFFDFSSEEREYILRMERQIADVEKRIKAGECIKEGAELGEQFISMNNQALDECIELGKARELYTERAQAIRESLDKSGLSPKQYTLNYKEEIPSLIEEAFRSAGSQSEQMEILSCILSAVSQAAERATAETAQNTKKEEDAQDTEKQELLEIFTKLNAGGRAETLKRIREMYNLLEYKLPKD